MHQVYPEARAAKEIEPSVILTEDSNAGHEMFRAVSQNMKTACDSARGKSNVAKYILTHKEEQILVNPAIEYCSGRRIEGDFGTAGGIYRKW